MEVDIKLSPKQFEAFERLNDSETSEILYGGAAGSGKSWLGCIWLVTSCLKYPGSRWLMGRAVLKTLKETTLLSLFDVCKTFKLESGRDFRYNQQSGVIRFSNGSEIYLKDLFLYPSDPEFDSLGSTEYTGCFIDEASQVSVKAKNVIQSRLRYKNDDYGIIPKSLYTSNPSMNWLFLEFYKPWEN